MTFYGYFGKSSPLSVKPFLMMLFTARLSDREQLNLKDKSGVRTDYISCPALGIGKSGRNEELPL